MATPQPAAEADPTALPADRDPRRLLQRKADLAHLPEARRDHLKRITESLCRTVPLDWLILFGSHARGDWVEDFDTGYRSDYDLLVIPSEPFLIDRTLLWARLEKELNAIADPVPVTLLVHTIQEVNRHLRKGQYFFTDIVKEGIALLDANRTSLASPPTLIPPQDRLKQASFDLNYWFNSANGFWRGTGYYMARGENAHAAFSLHQSVERYLHAMTLVFINYKYRTHDIEKLATKAADLHPNLIDALPRTDPADRDRFELLKRAYIDARYSKGYRISEELLGVLREQVLDLARRILPAAREKLESFLGADAVGPLPAVAEYGQEVEPPPVPTLDDPEAVARWSRLLMEESEERGELRGRKAGMAEGIEKGMEKGRRDQALQIARTLLAKGSSAGEVAEIVGLPPEEVAALSNDR